MHNSKEKSTCYITKEKVDIQDIWLLGRIVLLSEAITPSQRMLYQTNKSSRLNTNNTKCEKTINLP